MSHPSSVSTPASRSFPEWRLEANGYVAVISSIGATLRELTYGGRHLVVPFHSGEIRPLYRGATIAPWPNRIADGRYTFDGSQHQLPINEVDRGTALHGLVHWARWDPFVAEPTRLALRHALVPQDGYPFPLQLQATFEIGPNGLNSSLSATNLGHVTAPYGCCPHPYLIGGAGTVDSWRLTLPAGSRLEVDNRLLPTHLTAVTEVDNDFRTPAPIGKREIDHAFTDLIRDEDGRATVRIVDPDTGDGTELSWGSWAPWVQIHTADRPEAENNRVGLAVEPMNCPPNAFNLGDDIPVLQPGETHEADWVISAISGREGEASNV